MALRFLDSFDHYAGGDIREKWTDTDGHASNPPQIGLWGRRDTNGLRFGTQPDYGVGLLNPNPVRLTPPGVTEVESQVCVVGFAFTAREAGMNTSGWSGGFIGPGSSIADNWALAVCWGQFVNVAFVLQPDGTFWAVRGQSRAPAFATAFLANNASIFLGATTIPIRRDETNYLEFKVTAGNGTGAIEVRVNGLTALNLTGIYTTHHFDSGLDYTERWNNIMIGQIFGSPSMGWDYDDLYVADETVLPLNDVVDFMGDVRVDYRLPTADGFHSDFTPLTGPDNFAMVDDAVPDDDLSYNASATAAAKDTFVIENVPVVLAVIKGVQVIYSRKKTLDGPATSRALLRSAGTTYHGDTVGDPSTAYAYAWHIWTKDPADSLAITETDFNNFEVGYEKVV